MWNMKRMKRGPASVFIIHMMTLLHLLQLLQNPQKAL